MTTKLLSLGAVGFCVFSYIIGQLDPNNVLVYAFLANNPVSIIVKFVLTAFMLFVVYKRGFKTYRARVGLRLFSVALILFGILAPYSPMILDAVYGYFRLLDLMLVVEIGIILAIVSLHSGPIQKPAWRLHEWLMPAWIALPVIRAVTPKLMAGVRDSMLAALREEQPQTKVAHQ